MGQGRCGAGVIKDRFAARAPLAMTVGLRAYGARNDGVYAVTARPWAFGKAEAVFDPMTRVQGEIRIASASFVGLAMTVGVRHCEALGIWQGRSSL